MTSVEVVSMPNELEELAQSAIAYIYDAFAAPVPFESPTIYGTILHYPNIPRYLRHDFVNTFTPQCGKLVRVLKNVPFD
jgi:hypothetical protein